MRIIITGAGGFVGSTLIAALGNAHDVTAVDNRLNDVVGIEGDITDPAVVEQAFAKGCDAVIHLATVPGGAAELDPGRAKAVNIDATMALVDAAAAAANRPKFIFASSIAVYGEPLPAYVDDATPVAPKMVYGAHKAMMEQWVGTQSRRGAIEGVTLRLPGIVARPEAPSGMKSAFMSNVFHALRSGEAYVSPVSPHATMWLMSADRVSLNIIRALTHDVDAQTLTLPALRIHFADLVAEIARQTGADIHRVRYAPDAALELAFGKQPPLTTTKADSLGFVHDGTLEHLVAAALTGIG